MIKKGKISKLTLPSVRTMVLPRPGWILYPLKLQSCILKYKKPGWASSIIAVLECIDIRLDNTKMSQIFHDIYEALERNSLHVEGNNCERQRVNKWASTCALSGFEFYYFQLLTHLLNIFRFQFALVINLIYFDIFFVS